MIAKTASIDSLMPAALEEPEHLQGVIDAFNRPSSAACRAERRVERLSIMIWSRFTQICYISFTK